MRVEKLDALIVAGDLSNTFGNSMRDALAFLGRYLPADRLYVVPGNHDYYAARLDDESPIRDLVRANGSWFAQKTELRHGNDRYLCATLWTDFELLGNRESAMRDARRSMRDYEMISTTASDDATLEVDVIRPGRTSQITPQDTVARHREHRSWLEARLAEAHFAAGGRTFVITHHGPHPAAAGVMESLTPAFHSSLNEIFETYDIDCWYFGHSHRRLSAEIAGTRGQNVSIGYPDEKHGRQEDDLEQVCFVSVPIGETRYD